MSSPHIAYAPSTHATPQVEASALANVYRLVLDCRKKEGSRPEAPEDARKDKNAGIHSDCT